MEEKGSTISFSLFTGFSESFSIDRRTKSPRSYENGGVGLGIVAAMTGSSNITQFPDKFSNFLAISARSNPIPIVSLIKPAGNSDGTVGLLNFDQECGGGGDFMDDEIDESYTCVISRAGNDVIKKCVYYGDELGGFVDGSVSVFDVTPGLFYASSSPIMMAMNVGGEEKFQLWTTDFLSSCYLCKKLLHGLDIFMYRGEKGFCSTECRDKQIRREDRKERCGAEARKAHDFSSMSPCSSPQVFSSGIVAA